jgi:hypothetical protein
MSVLKKEGSQSVTNCHRLKMEAVDGNHIHRCWNIVRAQTSTMDKAKAWLKEHGQLLEQALIMTTSTAPLQVLSVKKP